MNVPTYLGQHGPLKLMRWGPAEGELRVYQKHIRSPVKD